MTVGLLEKDDVLRWAQWMKKAGCNKLYALGEDFSPYSQRWWPSWTA